MINIPEETFQAHCAQQLEKLARDLDQTELSISEIARDTRMKWDTVNRAMTCRPIRFDSAERLRLYVATLKETRNK